VNILMNKVVKLPAETLNKYLNEFWEELKQEGYQGSETDAKQQFMNRVAEMYKNQGNTYFQNKRYATSIDLYNAAIEINPSAVYYSNLAAAYFNAKDYPSCLNACQKGIELDPNFSKTYFRLGRCQKELNQYEEALRSYNKSLELDPKDNNVKNARDQLIVEMRKKGYSV
jgi:tetratricopeptide (TPR) repeat protein